MLLAEATFSEYIVQTKFPLGKKTWGHFIINYFSIILRLLFMEKKRDPKSLISLIFMWIEMLSSSQHILLKITTSQFHEVQCYDTITNPNFQQEN